MKSRSRGGKPPRKIDKHWIDDAIERARRQLQDLKKHSRRNSLFTDLFGESRRRQLEIEISHYEHWKSLKGDD